MRARSLRDVENVWSNVDGWKRASDRIIGVGPFGIGLDGILTWVPGLGQVYTVGVGGWLLLQALRARAAPTTLVKMGAALVLDTAVGSVPLLGDAVDFFFPGHLMAAKFLQADIESTHWVNESLASARASGALDLHLSEMRARRKKRIVFLGGDGGGAAVPAPVR